MPERLKQLIEALGLSQREFSREVGLSSGALSQLMAGRSTSLSGNALTAINRRFGVDINWLLTGEGEMFLTPATVDWESRRRVGDFIEIRFYPKGLQPPADKNFQMVRAPIYYARHEQCFLTPTFDVEIAGAGVRKNDLVIVDPTLKPEDGSVVFSYLDGVYTIDYMRIYPDGRVCLKSDGHDEVDTTGRDLKIIGVGVAIYPRELRKVTKAAEAG